MSIYIARITHFNYLKCMQLTHTDFHCINVNINADFFWKILIIKEMYVTEESKSISFAFCESFSTLHIALTGCTKRHTDCKVCIRAVRAEIIMPIATSGMQGNAKIRCVVAYSCTCYLWSMKETRTIFFLNIYIEHPYKFPSLQLKSFNVGTLHCPPKLKYKLNLMLWRVVCGSTFLFISLISKLRYFDLRC